MKVELEVSLSSESKEWSEWVDQVSDRAWVYAPYSYWQARPYPVQHYQPGVISRPLVVRMTTRCGFPCLNLAFEEVKGQKKGFVEA